MSDARVQSLETHVRYDPLFHFFAIPVVVLTMLWSVVHAVRHPGFHPFGLIVISIAAVVVVFKERLYALKVQTRVIRLEERLRLYQILQEPLRSRIPELTESQLVGLRFASDGELPALVEQCFASKLSNADIKKAIKNWRPDNFRV